MIVSKGRTAVVTAVALLACVLAACSDDGDPEDTVDAFLTGWHSSRLNTVKYVEPSGQAVPAADVAKQLKAISGQLPAAPSKLQRVGKAVVKGDSATSTLKVAWTLPGGTQWAYKSAVRLHKHDGKWDVVWEPAVVYKDLKAGDTLALQRLEPARGSILDAAGSPIVQPRPVVTIRLDPAKVTDVAAVTGQLKAAFAAIDTDVDLSDLPTRLATAKTGNAVDVVVLRQEAFDQIASRIEAVAGASTAKSTLDLAPSRQFARALLGTVSDVTKEDIDKNPGKYVAGDHVGHGGLQAAFDAQLRGTAGEVISVRHAGSGTQATGTEVTRVQPKPGTPLSTTLDQGIQNAAETALRGISQRSALVAVRVSDGSVVAAANGPDGGTFNYAFQAQVPPGSTFKMVSALGLLDRGAIKADDTVPCPSHLAAGGRDFKNFDDFQLGNVPFRTDFAKSCNTAFVALAPKLGPDGLAEAGRSVGLETDYDLGVASFSGKISTGGDAAERAAAAFGQGQTVVSPLAMASATAAVASGRWLPPAIVREPRPSGAAQPSTSARPGASPGPELRPASLAPLRAMMRQVVTAGTATGLRDVPGQPVFGKTGTAEFDNNPDDAHAWFVGWQGDLAFAVFVENGGHSSDVSVPAAERFLRALK